jgi:hypothetical protein
MTTPHVEALREGWLEVRRDGDRWHFEVWDHLGEVCAHGWRATFDAALSDGRAWGVPCDAQRG